MKVAAALVFLLLEQSGHELFQQALVEERLEGNLEEAVVLYDRIAREFPRDRKLVASALLRMAHCREIQGDAAKAEAIYRRLVRDYADLRARARLNVLLPKEAPALAARRVWAEPGVDAEGSPAPDGSFLPFVDWETGDLALRELRSGRSRRLTQKGTWEESEAYALNAVVSPDSREIAYTWYDGTGGFELRAIQRDGSGGRIVLRTAEAGYIHPYEWSRRGDDILALLYREASEVQVVLVAARGGAIRVVETLDREPPFRMSLSPDGRHLVYDALQKSDASERDLYVRALTNGVASLLVEHPAQDAFPLWSPDGRHVVFISDRTGDPGLWLQRVIDGRAEGAPWIVKQDVGQSYPIGLTPDGDYYYALQTGIRDVYLATLDPATGAVVSPPAPISRRFLGSKGFADFSRDGTSLVYVSELDVLPWTVGARVITVRNLETGAERELRPALNRVLRPRWSSDGNFFLARGLDEKNRESLYQIDVRNGDLTVLAAIEGYFHSPEWTPDGGTVFYRWNDLGTDYFLIARHLRTQEERRIYRVPETAQLSTLALSPDGGTLAFVQSERGQGTAILTMPSSGGLPQPLVTASSERIAAIAWSPDGRYIYYGHDRLFRVAAEGGNPEPLDVSLESLSGISFHPDGRRIALTAGEYGEEIWVLENFLPGR